MFARSLAIAAVAAAFLVMAVVAHQTPYLPFDPPLARAVQAVHAPTLDLAARATSWVGFPPQVDVIVGAIALVTWLRRRRWEAAGVAVAGAGAALVYFSAELLVGQPRPAPDLVRVAASLPTTAFPSGHETTFTAVLGFLAWTSRRRLAGLLTGLFLLLMAWARVYQGEHWPSQVIAGVLLGSVWMAVTIRVYAPLRQRYTRTCRSPASSASSLSPR